MKLHPLWGWRHSKTRLWHSAGDSWDRTQGQQLDGAGKGSAGLFQQMPGWVTVPENWHVAGHTPWVAELQTVSDEAGISFLQSCLQIVHRLFSLGDARGKEQICASAEARGARNVSMSSLQGLQHGEKHSGKSRSIPHLSPQFQFSSCSLLCTHPSQRSRCRGGPCWQLAPPTSGLRVPHRS